MLPVSGSSPWGTTTTDQEPSPLRGVQSMVTLSELMLESCTLTGLRQLEVSYKATLSMYMAVELMYLNPISLPLPV